MKQVILILCVFAFSSCKSDLHDKIIGFYTIDEIYYDEQSILLDLGANIVSFNADGTCNLPAISRNEALKTEDRYGTWVINEFDTTLIISAVHPVFNNTFKLQFKKDFEEQLLKIVLESEDAYMVGSKGFQNFNSQKDNW